MVEAARKFTYRDYERLPEGVYFEIIDGEPMMSPSPALYHQDVLQLLYEAFIAFVRPGNLGKIYIAPSDVVLSDREIVQPDLLFVSSERSAIVGPNAIGGPPDLVVEVFGESSAYRDLVVKKALYAKHRVTEYWLVDLVAKRIEILTLRGAAYETAAASDGGTPAVSRVLKGFSVLPRDIFERP
jgi:Uma2 family endonuclease